jgi:nucleotide-binding universal stress UspA family protein
MPKLKILVPLDGTEKSMHSLAWLKKIFGKEEVEVTLIHVVEALSPASLNMTTTPKMQKG